MEAADLWATLGVRVDQASFAQGSAALAGAKRAADALDGAMQDKQGRWRAAGGRMLTLGEYSRTVARGMKSVGDAAEGAGDKAARGGSKAESSFLGFGRAIDAVAGYLTLKMGYDKLIKFNENMQTSIIGLSAMIEGNLGGSFSEAKAQAKDLYAEFQRFSASSPAQTADILAFGKSIAVATFQAKGSLKDLQNIAEQGIIASAVLTPEQGPAYAAREVSEMLMGNINNRMMFAKQLLGFVKMSEEQFRELNAKQRLETVKKAFNSKAMLDAKGEFLTSFVGVVSTAEDKIAQAFGKIGEALFAKLTASLSGFNDWLDKNDETIKRVGDSISNGLVVAFDVLTKSIEIVVAVIGFLSDHSDIVIAAFEAIAGLLIYMNLGFIATAISAAAAWIAIMGPIVLIVAALTAVAYGINYLRKHPEKVRAAFEAMGRGIVAAVDWVIEKVRAIGRRIADFFTDDIPRALKRAFEWLENLPVIGRLIHLVERLASFATGDGIAPTKEDAEQNVMSDLDRLNHPEDYARPRAPVRRLPGSGTTNNANRGDTNVNVDVGGMTIVSPNADPKEVAKHAGKVFDEKWDQRMRTAADAQ